MLFNSPEFLFGFLPAVILGTVLASRLAGKAGAMVFLVLASLFFYGWWNPWFLLLLCASIVINYVVGQWLIRRPSRPLLVAGLCLNLGVLGYFKYAGFALDTLNAAAGTEFSAGAIILPLGISFFTFQKIAFLVDAYRGRVRDMDFLSFGLFVLFFPQLIAGPIVHHSEFVPQIRAKARLTVQADDFWIGLTILAIGLYKKVVIADTLAGYADPVFATGGNDLSFAEAWGAVLSFTFQIYFDFSGYSDMAIGLARIFGIRLPLNFHSPYKAHNIIDFWRRWHMTLSRFLRDYVYVPLGGNRKGPARRYVNLMVTMLLGGLWHGASWTFVVWGGLHGACLIVNHAWHALMRAAGRDPAQPTLYGRAAGRLLTFLVVAISWVFFRADDWSTAIGLLTAMAGMNGFFPTVATPFADPAVFLWLAVVLAIVWYAPNTQEWMAPFRPALGSSLRDAGLAAVELRREEGSAVAAAPERRLMTFFSFVAVCGIVAVIVTITRSGGPSPFIYFVF